MMKLIGLKRIILLIVVVALNLLVLGVYFFSVGPMLSDAEANTASLNGEISGLHGQINSVKKDTDYLKENMPQYESLKKDGFFLPQDRFMIKDTMNKLRLQAGVSNLGFSVTSVQEIPDETAKDIHYKLIDSHISINKIISPLDANIYLLVQYMNKVFPDFVRLQSMEVHRTKDVDQAALKDIAAGKQVNFVDASIAFEWITMVPNPPAGAAAGNGFRGR